MLRSLRGGLPAFWMTLALVGCAPRPERAASGIDGALPATQETDPPPNPVGGGPARDSKAIPAGADRSTGDFTLAPISRAPEAVTSFGAAELDGRFFMIGGHIGRTHEHSSANQTKAFRSFTQRGEWSDLPGGIALQSVSLVAHQGRLIRIGGVAAKNKPGEDVDMRSTDEVSAFDPGSNTWTALPRLPDARSSHDTCVLDGKLYVFGGWKLSGVPGGDWPENGFTLDLSAREAAWKPVPQPFRRRAVAVAASRGKVYVVGGLTRDHEISQEVNVFDAATGTWSQGPDLPGPGFGASACTLEGRVYATDFTGNVVRLSEDGAKWDVVYRLAFARFFHRLIPGGSNRLVAICGSTHEGHSNSIEWIDLAAKGPRISTMRISCKGNARQRQGVFTTGSVLTAFGGNTEMDQHQFERENFSKQVWRIDLGVGEARRLNDLPVQRQSIAPLVFEAPDENKTWRLGYGGFGYDGEETVSHAQGFIYDGVSDEWKDLDVRLPAPLTQFGLAIYGGRVWLFGGMDFDPRRGEEKQFRLSDGVYAWDPHNDERFVEESRLPRSRRAFGSALLDGRIYLIGGLKQGFSEVPECDVFDIDAKSWTLIPSPARVRVSPHLVAFEGKLWLAGGSSPRAEGNGIEPNQAIECFDPRTQKWTTIVEKMPVSMKESYFFASGTRLIVYSAAQEGEFVEITLIDPRR